MDRRTYVAMTGLVSVGVLSTLGGCVGSSDDETQSGRNVPGDWQPAPGEWPYVTRYGPRGNRYNPHASPPRTEPRVAWSTDVDKIGSALFAIADGSMFVRSSGGLVAIDTGDGSEQWQRSLSSGAYIRYIDDRIYHLRPGGDEALTDNGEREWRMADGEKFSGEMETYVYTATTEGLAWYDSETGDRLGSIETDARPSVVADGTIYGLSPDGISAYEHDEAEPTRQWFTPVDDPFEPRQGGLTGFVIADETIYVTEQSDQSERLARYGLDGEQGETDTWEQSKISEVIVADGSEYILRNEHDSEWNTMQWYLTARDGDGTIRWQHTFPEQVNFPIVANDAVYLRVGDDLLSLDAETGERLWKLADIAGTLATVEDTLFVIPRDHTVYALQE